MTGENEISRNEKSNKLQVALLSGGGAGPGDIFDVAVFLLVCRLRTIREHFKHVVSYPYFEGVEAACSARTKEASMHSPRYSRLQGKASVQDGLRLAMENLKRSVCWFGIRAG